MPESQPAAPGPPAMSLAARLLNIFAIPGAVFDEVRAAAPSRANWLVPALLLIAVSWVGAWLLFSRGPLEQQLLESNERMVQKLAEKGHLTPEQAKLNRMVSTISVKVSPYAAPVVIALITPFGWGLILWLVGTRGLKASFAYWKGVEVAGLANTIAVLEKLVTILLIAGATGLLTWPGADPPAKPYDPQNPSPLLLLVINGMVFWRLAVRSIGLARLAGTPFVRAAMWVFGLWAAGATLIIGFGLAAQALLGG